MGEKGAKKTAAAAEAAERMLERLAPLGDVHDKRMFGGHGLFEAGKMFGLIDSAGTAFLKTDDSNRGMFEAVGAEKHGRMPYYRIPDDVLENEETLREWAAAAIRMSK